MSLPPSVVPDHPPVEYYPHSKSCPNLTVLYSNLRVHRKPEYQGIPGSADRRNTTPLQWYFYGVNEKTDTLEMKIKYLKNNPPRQLDYEEDEIRQFFTSFSTVFDNATIP